MREYAFVVFWEEIIAKHIVPTINGQGIFPEQCDIRLPDQKHALQCVLPDASDYIGWERAIGDRFCQGDSCF